MTKIQWFTLTGIILYLVWEFIVLDKWKAETSGPLIRVDLLIIYPLLALGIIYSVLQIFIKSCKKRNIAMVVACMLLLIGRYILGMIFPESI